MVRALPCCAQEAFCCYPCRSRRILLAHRVNINQTLVTLHHNSRSFEFSQVFSLLSISASQTCNRPSVSCLPSEQLLLSEPSTSMDDHQMWHPSWQPPWPNTSDTAAALQWQSSGTRGHRAGLHHLCFPDGLRALRELISTLAVPGRGRDKDQVLYHAKPTDKLAEGTERQSGQQLWVSVQKLSYWLLLKGDLREHVTARNSCLSPLNFKSPSLLTSNVPPPNWALRAEGCMRSLR